MGLFSFLTQELAIDLGTANTIIIHNDKIVVDEPSIVAVDTKTGKLIAIGYTARQMHGKTHENIKTIRPLRNGEQRKPDIYSFVKNGGQHSFRKY